MQVLLAKQEVGLGQAKCIILIFLEVATEI